VAQRPLLIVGAGGFGRETLEAVRALNRVEPTWDVLGFLDDDEARHGLEVDGLPIVGSIACAADHPDAQVVVTIGNPDNFTVRRRIVGTAATVSTLFTVVGQP